MNISSILDINGELHQIIDSSARQQLTQLSQVAHTGSYNDLLDKPLIPNINELQQLSSTVSQQINTMTATTTTAAQTINRLQNKASQIISSIPSDYNELVSKVDNLSGQLYSASAVKNVSSAIGSIYNKTNILFSPYIKYVIDVQSLVVPQDTTVSMVIASSTSTSTTQTNNAKVISIDLKTKSYQFSLTPMQAVTINAAGSYIHAFTNQKITGSFSIKYTLRQKESLIGSLQNNIDDVNKNVELISDTIYEQSTQSNNTIFEDKSLWQINSWKVQDGTVVSQQNNKRVRSKQPIYFSEDTAIVSDVYENQSYKAYAYTANGTAISPIKKDNKYVTQINKGQHVYIVLRKYVSATSQVSSANYTTDVQFTLSNFYVVTYRQSKLDSIQSRLNELQNVEVPCSNMKFVAHQGDRYRAPNNSIAAYELAGKEHFGAVYVDGIRKSLDGVWYTIKQPDTISLSTTSMVVQETNSSQINKVVISKSQYSGYSYQFSSYNSIQKAIAKLTQVIGFCKRYDMQLFINVTEQNCSEISAIINEYGMLQNTIFCGSISALNKVSNKYIQARCALHTDDTTGILNCYSSSSAATVLNNNGFKTKLTDSKGNLNINWRNPMIFVNNNIIKKQGSNGIREAYKLGLAVVAYDINDNRYGDKTQADAFSKYGVDYYISGGTYNF